MIESDHFVENTLRAMKKLDYGDQVIVQCFKKDRQIRVEKQTDTFTVHQEGFEKRSYEGMGTDQVKKLLKTLQRKEFPRSNKLWFKVEKNIEQLKIGSE